MFLEPGLSIMKELRFGNLFTELKNLGLNSTLLGKIICLKAFSKIIESDYPKIDV